MGTRGFILQPTYRIESGRPVVHLFGCLETGEPFLVRDDREIPHFYIRRDDRGRAAAAGATQIVGSRRETMDGRPVARVEVAIPSETPPLRSRLRKAGIACYESDVRFAMRYLINRGIQGSLSIEGPARSDPSLGQVYENPSISSADWEPKLSVLSIDIETDPKAQHLLSVALYGCGHSEVLLRDARNRPIPPDTSSFPNEQELLKAFSARVRELDPDVITGWNVVDFDFMVLFRVATRLGLKLRLGRGSEAARLRTSRSPWASYQALLPGRVVVDGIQLLRGSFVKMENYSLGSVAASVLGETKTITGHDRGAEILFQYENDLEHFIEYNRNDARLALEILEKLKLFELAVQRSRLTGLPIDRVSGSIAAFDFLYLSRLQERGIVAPSVGSSDTSTSNPGGHVLEPKPGLHQQVLVFDFKSLYPSLIRTFHIDPLGYVEEPVENPELIVAPNGTAFRRQAGILPQLLDGLFPRREAARAKGDQVASHAIKILMNSFYGVLGTPACRFFRPRLAGAITTFGREILLWTKERAEGYGFEVLYGDTDSLFVQSTQSEAQAVLEEGLKLVERLNTDLTRFVIERWGVESRLELELETLYRKLHFPSMRHGTGAARKRYVGLIGEGEDEEIVFTGMEVVRRDWTGLAKQVQRELYRRLFAGEEVATYLEGIVADLRAGHLDELLVYRKGLRKSVDEYTATTPPHVAAARKLSSPPGRVISYLMTSDGPEPFEESSHPLDYEHYVQKQVRPVAEGILELVGQNFDKVIGDDRQLNLFG